MNPSLDLADIYEDYTDDGQGLSKPIRTRVDNNEIFSGFDRNANYYSYPMDAPYEIFNDKDIRMWATMILPGTQWKGQKIIIQGGFIRPDGSYVFRTDASTQGKDGKTYYSFGAQDQKMYSGFSSVGGNYTRSGFLLRKFLQESKDVTSEWNKGFTDWIEFRYAEILMNYAEASIEHSSATGEQLKKGKSA